MTDANGCEVTELLRLKIPERDDWTMQGNAINPQQFIGSTNAADVEFRANNQPQLRLGSNGVTELLGTVKMTGVPEADSQMKHLLIDPVTGGIAFGFPYLPPIDAHPNTVSCWNGNQPEVLGAWESGLEKVYVCPQVNVGVGTQTPTAQLQVVGQQNAAATSGLIEILPQPNGNPVFEVQRAGIIKAGGVGGNTTLQVNTDGSILMGDVSNNIGLHIGTDGKTGIGLNNPQYMLDVCGTIRAKEMRVNIYGCDFVFEDDYQLMPLDDLRSFITYNHHLPNIDPAAIMEDPSGYSVGTLQSGLLQKVEELTLYILELEERIGVLENTSE